MTRMRSSFIAGLLAATAFAVPAYAVDLGGTVGGLVGGGGGGLGGGGLGGGALGGVSQTAGSVVNGVGETTRGVTENARIDTTSRDMNTGSRIRRDRSASRVEAPVNDLLVKVSSPADVNTAMTEAGYDPIDGTLAAAGLPTTGTLPLTVAVVAGNAAGAVTSPTPVESTVKFVTVTATEKVGGLAK